MTFMTLMNSIVNTDEEESKQVLDQSEKVEVKVDDAPAEEQKETKLSKAATSKKCVKAGVERYWTEEEKQRFEEGKDLYGTEYDRIAKHIGTRSTIQVRTRAQKFYQQLTKKAAKARKAGLEQPQKEDFCDNRTEQRSLLTDPSASTQLPQQQEQQAARGRAESGPERLVQQRGERSAAEGRGGPQHRPQHRPQHQPITREDPPPHRLVRTTSDKGLHSEDAPHGGETLCEDDVSAREREALWQRQQQRMTDFQLRRHGSLSYEHACQKRAADDQMLAMSSDRNRSRLRSTSFDSLRMRGRSEQDSMDPFAEGVMHNSDNTFEDETPGFQMGCRRKVTGCGETTARKMTGAMLQRSHQESPSQPGNPRVARAILEGAPSRCPSAGRANNASLMSRSHQISCHGDFQSVAASSPNRWSSEPEAPPLWSRHGPSTTLAARMMMEEREKEMMRRMRGSADSLRGHSEPSFDASPMGSPQHASSPRQRPSMTTASMMKTCYSNGFSTASSCPDGMMFTASRSSGGYVLNRGDFRGGQCGDPPSPGGLLQDAVQPPHGHASERREPAAQGRPPGPAAALGPMPYDHITAGSLHGSLALVPGKAAARHHAAAGPRSLPLRGMGAALEPLDDPACGLFSMPNPLELLLDDMLPVGVHDVGNPLGLGDVMMDEGDFLACVHDDAVLGVAGRGLPEPASSDKDSMVVGGAGGPDAGLDGMDGTTPRDSRDSRGSSNADTDDQALSPPKDADGNSLHDAGNDDGKFADMKMGMASDAPLKMPWGGKVGDHLALDDGAMEHGPGSGGAHEGPPHSPSTNGTDSFEELLYASEEPPRAGGVDVYVAPWPDHHDKSQSQDSVMMCKGPQGEGLMGDMDDVYSYDEFPVDASTPGSLLGSDLFTYGVSTDITEVTDITQRHSCSSWDSVGYDPDLHQQFRHHVPRPECSALARCSDGAISARAHLEWPMEPRRRAVDFTGLRLDPHMDPLDRKMADPPPPHPGHFWKPAPAPRDRDDPAAAFFYSADTSQASFAER